MKSFVTLADVAVGDRITSDEYLDQFRVLNVWQRGTRISVRGRYNEHGTVPVTVTVTASPAASVMEAARLAAVRVPAVAEGRDEADPCQRGTVGCRIDHRGDDTCETW